MPLPAIIIWVLLLGFVGLLFFKKFQGKKKYEGKILDVDPDWLNKSLSKYKEETPLLHQYYFHHDKDFFAQGHILEDRDHNIVYEADFLYNNVVGEDEVDFINHLIDYKHHHKIGHTKSSSVGVNNISTTVRSSFSFDGKDVYEYLESLGYSYRFNILGLAYQIDIYKDEQKVITLYSSNNGKNLYESDGPIVAKMGGNGLLIIETTLSHLDIAFLYAIVFARTELSSENLNQ